MSNGIYLTLEQYKDKDLPLTITINGHTYHSQFALATTQTTWFEMGKQHGMELGSDNTYSDKEMSRMHDAWYNEGYEAGYEAGIDHGIEQTLQDDRVKEELERTKQTWYAEGKEAGYGDGYEDGKKSITQEEFDRGWAYGYDAGKEEGYEAGKKANGYTVDDIKQLHTDNEFTRKLWYDKGKAAGYGKGWIEGHNTKTIKYFDEYSVKLEERLNSRYDDGYTDGYKQGKQAGISKINLNTEPVEQTELSKEYDKGFTKGYEEGFEEGKSEGYEIGKKANGISNKEIPGEYLAHIEEARLEGYKEGYSDAKEGGQAEGYKDGPEQSEYAKGYEEGYAEGKEAGYEEGFMNLRFLIKK